MEQFSLVELLKQVIVKTNFHWGMEENLLHHFGQMLILLVEGMCGIESPNHQLCLLKLINK